MKKIIVLIFACVTAVSVSGQINFGVKAGVSTTNLSMPSIATITSGSSSYTINALTTARYGFHGGIFFRFTLLGIYLQPEFLFTTRTNEYTVQNIQATSSTIVKQNFNKLDIPVMLGVKLGPLRLNAGPSGSLLINSPKDLIANPDYKNRYNRMTIGYQAGVGLDILKFLTLDVRYEGSLKKYQNQIQNITGTKFNLDDRPNAFLFSVGLMF